MSQPISDFFLNNPPPQDFKNLSDKIKKFVKGQSSTNIVLVTSGGTAVPLEQNTVRFVDNFSAGTRGACSAENFWEKGYAVIFLHRLKSLEPFSRHFGNSMILDFLEKEDDRLVVKRDKLASLLPVFEKYQDALASGRFLSIPFTTLADYLWLIRGACESLHGCGRSAMLYLAAAVSDFYIPNEQMPVHKMQSSAGAPTICLQLVPKMLKPLVSTWVPNAFVVSFKLETDESILIQKARDSLRTYRHHIVVANILQKRRSQVIIVTENSETSLTVSGDQEVEELIVNELVKRHSAFRTR